MYDTQNRILVDHAANDSDKTFTVPADREWLVKAVLIDYTSTATAGDRLVTVDYSDGTVVHFTIQAVAVPASQSNDKLHGYRVVGQPLAASEAVAGQQYFSLPDVWLPPGWRLRVWDAAAIAATADDMLVDVWVEERSEVT